MAWKRILLQFCHFHSVFRAPFVSHARSQASISIKSVDKLYKPRISNHSADLPYLNPVEKLEGKVSLLLANTIVTVVSSEHEKLFQLTVCSVFFVFIVFVSAMKRIKKTARPLREIEKNFELLKAHYAALWIYDFWLIHKNLSHDLFRNYFPFLLTPSESSLREDSLSGYHTRRFNNWRRQKWFHLFAATRSVAFWSRKNWIGR